MSYTGRNPDAFMSAATGSNEGSPGQRDYRTNGPDAETGVNVRIEHIRGSAERPTREQAMGLDALRRVQNLSIQLGDHVMPRPRTGLAKQDYPSGTPSGSYRIDQYGNRRGHTIKARQQYPGGPETDGMARPSGHDPVNETPPYDYLSNPQGPDHPVVHYPLCSDGQCKGLCGGLCCLAHPMQRRAVGSIFNSVNVGRDITNLANSPSAKTAAGTTKKTTLAKVDPNEVSRAEIARILHDYGPNGEPR